MEDALHPIQGLPPEGRLELQPSTQLPVMAFGSFASCAVGDDADSVGAVGDVRADTVLRETACCLCGLATCFGASTTTLGSEVVAPPEGVAACDIVVPLRPHTTAKLATKSDENLIAKSSQMRGQPIPSRSAGYHALMRMEPRPI